MERGFTMDSVLVTNTLANNARRFLNASLGAGEFHVLGVCEGCDCSA